MPPIIVVFYSPHPDHGHDCSVTLAHLAEPLLDRPTVPKTSYKPTNSDEPYNSIPNTHPKALTPQELSRKLLDDDGGGWWHKLLSP
jgi:hypothetical protein